MDINYVNKWLEELASFWKNKDVDGAVSLFSRCTYYQESPFEEVATTQEEIKNLWNEILEQEDINLSFDVLSFVENTATVNYGFQCEAGNVSHSSNGIYVISFNEAGNCISFRQWYMLG